MRIDPATFQPKNVQGFIVVEGLNGAGKTTLQSRVAELLTQNNQKSLITREPGATTLGKTLRKLVLESKEEEICQMSELFLFAADRAQHVNKVILPNINSGTWVISDRYYYSTTAFQGYGRGIDMSIVDKINALAISGTLPDLTILLDLDPKLGLERINKRQASSGEKIVDTFEDESLEFHRRIRDGFLKISQSCSEPFLVVDATKSPEQIFAIIEPAISKLVSAKGKSA